MSLRKLFIFILVPALAAAGFTLASRANPDQTVNAERLETARSMIDANWPVSTEVRATTAGSIYLSNLNGQIAALEKQIEASPHDYHSAQLARLLYHRFQVLARLEDAEAAREIIASAAKNVGGRADIDHARILVGFHAFEEAEEVIRHAAQNGAPASEVDAVRRSIAHARGRVEPTIEPDDVSPLPSPVTLVGQASAWLNQGWPDKATGLLRMAQDQYTDSSPYTLAWIHVQQGIVFLENGDYGSARRFFAAAHERFPQFTLAAEHLAETELALGNHEKAAALYREVVERSGHPEFYHQLSRAESLVGNEAAADESAALAREKYERLVARYPLMYADHAVGYYIDMGERERAVALAEANLAQRQDKRAKELLATARECCQ